MNKRTFLGICAAGFGFHLLFPMRKITSLFNRLTVRPLSDRELVVAAIVAEYIYPQDGEPGALALGIDTYCAAQCASPYFRRYSPAIRRITALLDLESRKSGHDDFVAMETEPRTALLDDVFSGRSGGSHPDVSRNLSLLVDMTIEGCFSDPVHGGNREGGAWKLLNGTLKSEWFHG